MDQFEIINKEDVLEKNVHKQKEEEKNKDASLNAIPLQQNVNAHAPGDEEANKEKLQKSVYVSFENIGISLMEDVKDPQFLKADKKDSASFQQMKSAVDWVIALTKEIQAHKKDESKPNPNKADLVEAVVRLSEAANAYIDLHRGHRSTDKGATRKENANRLRFVTELFFNTIDQSIPKNASKNAVEGANLAREFKKDSKKRLSELASVYKKWAKHYAFQEGDERQKIKDKLNLFAPYEADIRKYQAARDILGLETDKNIKAIVDIYEGYKRRERVLSELEKDAATKNKLKDSIGAVVEKHVEDWDEQGKEERLSKEEVDKDLTEDQLKVVDEIDRWFMRNYNNAGAIGRVFAVRNHHGEVIEELFKKTKRERLFIYYLIQTGQRKNPSVMDVYKSQNTEELNLKAFKNQMLATKAKFYTRLTGGYVYMHKLTEAMQINHKYKELVKESGKAKTDLEAAIERRKNNESVDAIADPVEKRRALLGEFYAANVDYKDLAEKILKEKNATKKTDLQNQLQEKGRACDKIRKDLFAADDALKTDHAVRGNSNEDDIAEYTAEYTGHASTVVSSASSIANAPSVFNSSWELSNSSIAKIDYLSATISGTTIAAAGNLVAAVIGAYGYFSGVGNMHAGDIGAGFVEMLKSFASIGTDIWKSVEVGSKYLEVGEKILDEAMVYSEGLQTTGVVLSSVSLGINMYKTASGLLDMRNASNAKEYFDKKNKDKVVTKDDKQLRYEQNLVKLGKRVSAGKTAMAGYNSIVSGIALGSLFLPGIGAVIAGGVVMGASIVGSILKAVKTGDIQTALFDDYMNFDECYTKAVEESTKKGRVIHDDKAFKEQLRRKLAARAGFADMESAADQISKRYAEFVYKQLFEPDAPLSDEEKEAYIQLVKSFGLPYNEEKKKPSAQLLQGKLKGKV